MHSLHVHTSVTFVHNLSHFISPPCHFPNLGVLLVSVSPNVGAFHMPIIPLIHKPQTPSFTWSPTWITRRLALHDHPTLFTHHLALHEHPTRFPHHAHSPSPSSPDVLPIVWAHPHYSPTTKLFTRFTNSSKWSASMLVDWIPPSQLALSHLYDCLLIVWLPSRPATKHNFFGFNSSFAYQLTRYMGDRPPARRFIHRAAHRSGRPRLPSRI